MFINYPLKMCRTQDFLSNYYRSNKNPKLEMYVRCEAPHIHL